MGCCEERYGTLKAIQFDGDSKLKLRAETADARIVEISSIPANVAILTGGWGASVRTAETKDAAELSFQLLDFEDKPEVSSVWFQAELAGIGLKLTRSIALHRNAGIVRVEEILENSGAQERDVLWGQELALGAPFIDAQCRIDAPASSYFDPREEPILRMRWPLLADGTDLSRVTNEERSFYLTDFREGQCRVVNPAKKVAFDLRWDASKLPYCWARESAGALTLSPFSGLPKALEEGHGLLTIPAGGSESVWFEARVEIGE